MDIDAGSGGGMRLLVLAYAGSVQVWDASELGSVREGANLRIPGGRAENSVGQEMKGPVVTALALPAPPRGKQWTPLHCFAQAAAPSCSSLPPEGVQRAGSG